MKRDNSSNMLRLEKTELEIRFMPIICSAPLIYAHSHGFFKKNGLSVNLKPAPGWSGIKELMVHGLVDGVHMLSPMPLACSLGIDGKKADIRLATVQNVNGQALTLAKKHLGIKDARDMKGFTFGVPYRFSMHYYLLSYFLAENGINPLKDVTIKEVAPPRMPYYLAKGKVDGIFAPEPFNQIPVYRGTGFIYILSKDIWPGHPCCSFATSQDFIDRYPNTYRVMLKSILEAELELHKANAEERRVIAREISSPQHLNQEDPIPVEQALTGDFPDGRGGQHTVPDRIDFIPYPWPEYGSWILSQMQRWAQLPGKVDYREVIESVFQEDTRELIEALGFEREDKPKLKGINPFADGDAFSYMVNQPYCAFQERRKPLKKYDLSEPAREHLSNIIRRMAEVAGGKFEVEIEVTADDEIGILEQILNEMILNMKFAREGLAEQKDRLEELVKERTGELEKELTERKRAEEALRKAHNELERRVEERTSELSKSNALLRQEITDRKRAEEALRERSHDLGERMKELNCLHWLSQLTADPDSSIDEVLSELVELTPPSWQYPDITCARIVFEDQEFHTHNYRETPWRQSANIMVSGRQAGTLEVYYLEEKPEVDEGPFLKEERNLIEALTREVGKHAEHKQAEEVLSRTIAEYTAMIDTVPAMIYLKDIDHRYVAANEALCTAVGKKLDDIIGKTDYDIFPWEKADEFHKADKLVMDEDRKIVNREEQIIDAKGETRWISITRVPVHDNQGLVSGMVGLVQDVTEYHRSLEQLVQADKLAAIGTLAAGVAHEINNPIGFISSNLNTMNKYLKKMNSYIERTGTEEDEDKEAILEILTDFADAVGESTEGTTRVKNIVADLKSFSRVDRAEKERTNINDGIESTLNMVWNELKYHCKVEKDLGDIPDLYCIPNQLNQVYMNLLLNAGHATKGKSGLINIRTWADDANIYVSVKDNGVGIPEENVKKIFEPFFTTKDVGQGTGLGLSLAFDIIKKHGGNIEVKSKVGVGTEFIVALPCEGVPVG